MRLLCPKCVVDVEIEAQFSGPHIKAVCEICKSYIKFLNKKEKEIIEREQDKKE
jgi:hypothetical protein